jgi:Domain of unknown function (DUF5916)/Carbohydrate family 9 binding domain-like
MIPRNVRTLVRPSCAGLIIGTIAALLPALSLAQNVNAGVGRDRAPNSVAPNPVAPETVSRVADGGVTVRAVRIAEPIHVDGMLDEAIYTAVPSISDFIQQEPHEGAPATEKTEAWIFFDSQNLYIAARCWDSQPEREIANEMRRDGQQILQNENFTVIFDTFYDRRNGFMFQTNSLGAMRDTMSTDETNQNQDWNTVWDVRTQRSDKGWTVEYVIPFKSLRYGPGSEQIWGVNMRRIVRWKNEWSFLSAPPAYLAQRSIIATSLAATMVGLEVPKSRPILELKPYGISGLRTDLNASPPFTNDGDKDWGADAKLGVTKGLTMDLTYNTDFAQVEDDTQQVNLTRFNLFFPERREFFLEGQGIFAFGGVTQMGAGGGGGGTGLGFGVNNMNTPVLFFSRRIGLNNGAPVPIAGGGRLNGHEGAYSIGLLNIQSKDDFTNAASPAYATNFSVVRLKRDLLKRSNVGLLYTHRAETTAGGRPPGDTFGIDGLFSASTALNVNWYFARTRTSELQGKDDSYLGSFDYNVDRYGLQLQHLKVGEHFVPQVGFLRRSDFKRSFAQARFSPRPARGHMTAIRRFIYAGNIEYIENNQGRLDFREQEGQFQIEMVNSDIANVDFTNDYEFIPQPFQISTGVIVPAGGYTYNSLLTSYYLGSQHPLAGTVSAQVGQLYGGTKETLGLASGRVELTSQLSLEPSFSVNWVDLPSGSFTATVVTNRTTFTVSPRMFVSALVQYNSSASALSTNARFRWEYQPGSELFVVYSDGRDTAPTGVPVVINRAFIVKITKLFRL